MRTSMFSGFKNRFWKKATLLEMAKFSFYLMVPIGASAIYANPEVMKELILKLNLVEYPKSTSRMPTVEEMEQHFKKEKEKKKEA